MPSSRPTRVVGEILAFIDEGSLSIQDTVGNSLQKFLMDQLINYQALQFEKFKQADAEEIERTEVTTKGAIGAQGPGQKKYSYLNNTKGKETLCWKVLRQIPSYNGYNSPSGTLQPLSYYEQYGCYGTRRFSQLLTPKYSMLTTEWNQTKPFNDHAPWVTNTKRAYAGCVATAVAQIMAYHSYPTHYPNGSLTHISNLRKYKQWNDFPNTVTKNAVATFFRKIGDLLNNRWQTVDKDGTGANCSDVPSCFTAMGYTSPGSDIPYNLFDVVESLDSNMPVYISGCTPDYQNCHAWVIDGYKVLNRGYDFFYFNSAAIYNGKTDGELYVDETYLCCNFGWGGDSDGYYLEQAFNTNTGPVYQNAQIDTKYNFNTGFTIIPFIHN